MRLLDLLFCVLYEQEKLILLTGRRRNRPNSLADFQQCGGYIEVYKLPATVPLLTIVGKVTVRSRHPLLDSP